VIQNAKEELLQCLTEECSEVIKAHSKILRFGETPNRVQELKEEIADVMGCISMLFEEWNLSEQQQKEIYKLADASMKKRDGFMTFKPKVRHEEK
jgi:NTP pyrophosphatase (non-canonical NTP hydrolase)